jgi:hypothetical protein
MITQIGGIEDKIQRQRPLDGDIPGLDAGMRIVLGETRIAVVGGFRIMPSAWICTTVGSGNPTFIEPAAL